MEIKFEIIEEDYIKFNLYHAENSPSLKKSYHLMRYVLPLLCAIPIYTIGTYIFKQPSIYWSFIAISFVIIWILVYPNKYKRLIQKQTKKLLQEGDNSTFFGKKTLLFEDDNIKLISECSSETILKKSIKTIKIYDDMILIYLSGFTAIIIPTRYLNDESRKYIMNEFNKIL